jgi:chromosome segregation ATPase
MTLAIIAVVVTIIVFVIWIACLHKAKKEDADISSVWAETEKSEETVEVPEVPVTETEKETTIVEDEPKLVEPPSLVMTNTNTVAVEPIENPWANCKTVECESKPIAELEAAQEIKEAPKAKAKKERKPRKSQLERTEEAIAKLEGQIGRRSTLLKQLKKPVTKDERLNKWKASLKELKATKKELVKASKPMKANKTK